MDTESSRADYFEPQLEPRFTEAEVPIGSVGRSVSAIENELGGSTSSTSDGLSVLVAEIEDNTIRSAALIEDRGRGNFTVLPLNEGQLRAVLAMPDFEASMSIANDVGKPLSVDPGDDVVHVLEPQNGVDLSDLPVYNPPNESWIDRREDMRSDIDQQMVVIGKSEDGTRVIGRDGGAFVSVARDAFSEDPKYQSLVTLSRDSAGREQAALNQEHERDLGR